MNFLSFSLILLFGILFGFIFQDLLKELGVSKERAHSFIAIFGLAFIAFLGYILLPFSIYGVFQLNPVEGFYKTEIFWITVCLLIGGLGRFAFYHIFKK